MINKLRRDVIVVFILLFVELLIITVKFKRSFHNYSTDFLISYNNIMNGCMRVYVYFDILLFRSYLTFYRRIITKNTDLSRMQAPTDRIYMYDA
jgi:hypothetical protein